MFLSLQQMNNTTTNSEWFQDWFDSPFYHMLYFKRNEKEAQAFILRLLDHLNPAKDAIMLDLACGKGRHSRFLADQGFEVVGLDLSLQSIRFAKQFETPRLSFYQHDMRLPFRSNYFDYIFNFFTSFGYFKHERDDIGVLRSAARGLKRGGVMILDFFNATYIREHLVPTETLKLENITFSIQRYLDLERVHKLIEFETEGENKHYEESVSLFTLADFQRLCSKAGLEIIQIFGDYQLNTYDAKNSPRLILLMRKA